MSGRTAPNIFACWVGFQRFLERPSKRSRDGCEPGASPDDEAPIIRKPVTESKRTALDDGINRGPLAEL
jgi:hypothetical protein